MALFSRKASPTPVESSTPTRSPTYWHNLDNVRAEWPRQSLDADADMQKWREGIALYEARDDWASMMRCTRLLAPSIAHNLHGDGILRGDSFPETVHKVLYSGLQAPPDGQTFTDETQRCLRLVLTLVRENGWVPIEFGGTMDFFGPMITDRGNRMLLSMTIAPPGQPWQGDIAAFFRVPPTPLKTAIPKVADSGASAVDRMFETMKQADSGNSASEAHMSGMASWAMGNLEQAQRELERAAELGSIAAMKDAGDLAMSMGRQGQARFWFESAANLGNAAAMWNVAVQAFNDNDLTTAAHWYLRAADAGEVDGYAALVQLASDRGDDAEERRWALLGAEAGQPFCMARHGLFLLMESSNDVPLLRRARDYLEAAAAHGDHDAIGLAASANLQLGEEARGRRYVQQAVETGDQELIDRLRRHGFV